MPRYANAAVLPKLHRDPAERTRIGGDISADAVEDAEHRGRRGTGFRQVQPAWKAVRVVGEVDLDSSIGRARRDRYRDTYSIRDLRHRVARRLLRVVANRPAGECSGFQ